MSVVIHSPPYLQNILKIGQYTKIPFIGVEKIINLNIFNYYGKKEKRRRKKSCRK
jgi:hypothetical protein